MDVWLAEYLWLMAAFFIGVFLGCMTGLIPGFHVNNVALIALSMSPLAVGIGIPLSAVAAIIAAIALATRSHFIVVPPRDRSALTKLRAGVVSMWASVVVLCGCRRIFVVPSPPWGAGSGSLMLYE